MPPQILLCTFILTHNDNCICVHLLRMTTEGAPRREQTTHNTRSSMAKNNTGMNINRQKKKKKDKILQNPELMFTYHIASFKGSASLRAGHSASSLPAVVKAEARNCPRSTVHFNLDDTSSQHSVLTSELVLRHFASVRQCSACKPFP